MSDLKLAEAIFHMHEAAYAHHNRSVEQNVDQIEELNGQIRQLTSFLQAVNQQRDSGRVELNTEEQRDMVDAARLLVPNAIAEHTYVWDSKDKIDHLVEGINLEIKSLSGQMQPLSSYMVEAFDQRKTAINECNKLMERLIRHLDDMVRKQKA